MKIALGPVQYFWDKDAMTAFYNAVATLPVDIVYLGEVVCQKRRMLRLGDWLRIGEQLAACGKEVVLSTLTLAESDAEQGVIKRICRNQRFSVEANDMSAVYWRASAGAFVAGPYLNMYNEAALAVIAADGAYRFVAPPELSADALATLIALRPQTLESEVFAFGRVPLAFSARCFTARAANVGKDECARRCGAYPEGLVVATQEGSALFVINGIQIQSARTINLAGDLETLQRMGVDAVRISPQRHGTDEIARLFRAGLDGTLTRTELLERLRPFEGAAGAANGYLHGQAGMSWQE